MNVGGGDDLYSKDDMIYDVYLSMATFFLTVFYRLEKEICNVYDLLMRI